MMKIVLLMLTMLSNILVMVIQSILIQNHHLTILDRTSINGYQVNLMFQLLVKLKSNHISIIYIQLNIKNYIMSLNKSLNVSYLYLTKF